MSRPNTPPNAQIAPSLALTRHDDMAAYDACPPAVRRRLRNLPVDVASTRILEAVYALGEGTTLEILAEAERDIVRGMRKEMAEATAR